MANYKVLAIIVLRIVFGVTGSKEDNNNDQEITKLFPPPHLSNIPISPYDRPQYIFTVHSNNSLFAFDINMGGSGGIIGRTASKYDSGYRLSVVVEKIVCHGSDNHLVLEGQGVGGHVTRSLKICLTEDNRENNWQSVNNVLDDVIVAEVKAEGDWSGLYAQLVVNIYYEVDGGCSNCNKDEFCCGITPKKDEKKARCIPEMGFCNGHPNCGMHSNLDESDATCSPRGGCVGSDCLALRIAILVVFCFLLPPTLILLACRFQSARKWCAALNVRISRHCRRRTTRARNGSASESSARNSTIPRRSEHDSRRQIVSATYNADEDQPPSYEDFLRSQPPSMVSVSVIPVKEAPPPTFDQAMNGNYPGHGGGEHGGGAVNPAFVFSEDLSSTSRESDS
ncbi:uncharacterized protein LOC110862718 isoform X2 [Folsomia candida]|uniref:uncharacterized protein LOC110862718 isoform X2 n=1 Tax=Folsomia candida TaxID=158441 RepID=UPI000B8F2CB5|nr:uncharacterized protein LOC110862718 isoform X2 [Folsomia candida]